MVEGGICGCGRPRVLEGGKRERFLQGMARRPRMTRRRPLGEKRNFAEDRKFAEKSLGAQSNESATENLARRESGMRLLPEGTIWARREESMNTVRS